MKGLLIYQFCVLSLFILAGCYKTEYSGTLTEKGKVMDTYITPGEIHHNTTVSTDSDGDMHVQSYTSEIPTKYSVMFQCEHSVRFVIIGSDALHKELFERMSKVPKDSSVAISYREVYHVDTKTGEKRIHDYDFLDAK